MCTRYEALRRRFRTTKLTKDLKHPHTFQGPAIVVHDPDGSKRLMSYNLFVARVDPDGVFHRLARGYGRATDKHVYLFAREFCPKVLPLLRKSNEIQ